MKMPSEKKTEKSATERGWKHAIKSGRTNRGNLQVNLEFLEKTTLIGTDKKVLELGCGSGQLASLLFEKGVSIVASDISETAIEHAREMNPAVEFQAYSAEELPHENGSFDIVMSFDVLEHLPNVDRHLNEVQRVLKSQGYYLFQTPNKLSNVIFETLKSRSMAWKKYHPSLHFFGQLRRRLKHHGFSCRFVKMNTMNEFSIKKIKKIGLPGWLFAWINFRYMPYRLQTNFYVIAQKN